MIQRILEQADAIQHFKRYRDVVRHEPLSPSKVAPCKRVWQLWLQGADQAPPIVSACLKSVRRHLSGQEVILLNEHNIEDYVALPGHIYDRKRRGQITNVKFSDVLRAYLLAEHGGTWIDATVYLTATPPARFLELPLFCFSLTPAELMGAGHVLASSWFLHAEQGNVLIASVRDMLTEFWRHESHCDFSFYYQFHLMFALAVKESEACAKSWEAVPFFSNVPPHVLQFELFHRFDPARFEEIKQMSPIHKLTHYGDDKFQLENGGTFFSQLIVDAGRFNTP